MAENYKKWNSHEKKIEIIFISGDRDEKSFTDYFQSMPWFALPYENTHVNEELEKKYRVEGIPTLVIVDKNGEILKKDGREDVQTKGQDALEIFRALYN